MAQSYCLNIPCNKRKDFTLFGINKNVYSMVYFIILSDKYPHCRFTASFNPSVNHKTYFGTITCLWYQSTEKQIVSNQTAYCYNQLHVIGRLKNINEENKASMDEICSRIDVYMNHHPDLI